MARGTVKWFDARKGYGFILPEGGGQDVFVHYKSIECEGFRTLKNGELVEYEAADSGKGPQAKSVRALSGKKQVQPAY